MFLGGDTLGKRIRDLLVSPLGLPIGRNGSIRKLSYFPDKEDKVRVVAI